MRLKQRIIRILVHEIVADVDDAASEIVLLLLHWTGGRHSELRIEELPSVSIDAVQAWRRSKRFGRWQANSPISRLPLR